MSAPAKTLSRSGILGALLHLGILAYTVYLVLARAAPDWPMYWVLFLALDFPLSLAVLPVNWLVPPSGAGPLADVTNFWWPLAFHGTVGTAWWYVVGAAIGKRVWRREPRPAHEEPAAPDEPAPRP
jgi:hypothetical protein